MTRVSLAGRLLAALRPTLRVGLALGADRVAAVALTPGSRTLASVPLWEQEIARWDATRAEWPALAAAFGEMREALTDEAGAGRRVEVHVALLPSLAQSRRVELPPLRPHERVAVLGRDAARHFAAAHEPQVVGAVARGTRRARWRPGAGRLATQGRPVVTLAAACPVALLDALLHAAAASGFDVASVGHACGAWAAAAAALWPVLRSAGGCVVVGGAGGGEDDVTHVVRLAAGGGIAALRRLPGRLATPDAVAAAAAGVPAAAHLAGRVGDRASLESALASAGASVQRPPTEWDSQFTDSPAAVAALFAAESAQPEHGPELVPAALERRRTSAMLRTAALYATAAVALLGTAAATEQRARARELGGLTARRRELAPTVTDAVALRGSLAQLGDRAATLEGLEAGARPWSVVLARVALHLPGDAHLTSVRASGDTLRLAGVAERAGLAVAALRTAPGVVEVRADAPIRREGMNDGRRAVERFTVVMRLAPAVGGAR